MSGFRKTVGLWLWIGCSAPIGCGQDGSDSEPGWVPDGPLIGGWVQLQQSATLRYFSALAMADDAIFSWSGSTGASGGMLDLTTNEWRTISLAYAPTARTFASSMWTGTEVLVWGGRALDNGVILPDGGAYKPDTDTWRAIPPAEGAMGRRLEVRVWTGSELVVWGGVGPSSASSDNQILGDGGAYNPATNTWRTISPEGAPTPRARASSVWTGREVIVWGGTTSTSNGVDEVTSSPAGDDAAAYNPATDSWRSLSTKNAPRSATGVSAVWMGDEVLFWNGRSPRLMARYSPSTDVWTSMDPAGPELEYGSCRVWTGRYFVVCGDETSPEAGAAFEPSSGVWYRIPALPDESLSGLTGFSYNGDVLGFGGQNHYDTKASDAGWRLSLLE